jgi:hypothetical protein
MRPANLGIVALSLAVLMTAAPPRPATAAPQSYATGSTLFFLDNALAGPAQAVSGGVLIADAVVEGTTAAGSFPKKHPSAPRFEPLHLRLAAAPSKLVVQWLSAALAGKPPAKTGTLVTYDAVYKELERRTFTNLRVVEIGFPVFDAASKSVASLAVVAQADGVALAPGTGQPAPTMTKAKTALASSFRLTLDDLDTRQVSGISGITVKLGSRGDISNFTVMIGAASALPWHKWYEAFVVKRQGTDANEKSGTLDILGADMRTAVLRIHLDGVGILRLEPAGQPGGVEAIPRVKAELYAESIRLDLP